MKTLIVHPSELKGEVELPTSKSHSIRAIVFATMAHGTSRLDKLLGSPDIEHALKASGQVGAKITFSNGPIEIEGTGGVFHAPEQEIDAGNSGQVLRFFGALAALCDKEVTLTGDDSIKTNRPVKPLLDALNMMGASAKSANDNNMAPIHIKGPAKAAEVTLDGEDSQPVSGILMLAAHLDGTSTIHVTHPGEKPWIELTLDWFKRLNIDCENQDYALYKVSGKNKYKGFNYTVPGDLSSAAFPTAAAFATKSKLVLKNFDRSDVQGDKKFFDALEEMGASFKYDKKKKELFVDGTQTLTGKELDINDYIDAVTILAVIGALAEGKTVLKNAAIARKKESDRIFCIVQELKKMNVDIQETEDGLIVKKSDFKDATVESHQDHRIAMSLVVAGLAADGSTIVQNTECIRKSYPNFVEDLSALGARIEVQ